MITLKSGIILLSSTKIVGLIYVIGIKVHSLLWGFLFQYLAYVKEIYSELILERPLSQKYCCIVVKVFKFFINPIYFPLMTKLVLRRFWKFINF